MSDIKLYQGDCLEVMNELIAQGIKVDAVITDPPYGTTACKWDSVIPFDKMWERLYKIRKEKSPIILFGCEPFSSALRISNIKEYKYDWIWEKTKPCNFLNSHKQPIRNYENVSVFYKKQCNYYPQNLIAGVFNNSRKAKNIEKDSTYGKQREHGFSFYTNYPKQIIKFPNPAVIGHQHPTQKPVSLMEYLVKTYTKEGDTVLDFTMGSDTTGIACKNLNRNFIGIELDEKYFKVAKERIDNTAVQNKLF